MTESESSSEAKQQHQQADDSVLSMLGVGKQLWKRESGDRFVERLRSTGLLLAPFKGQSNVPAENAAESKIGPSSK